MEAEVNEMKQYCIIPCSKGKHSIESIECWTLMMKFDIIWKTLTSNEETVIWNSLKV